MNQQSASNISSLLVLSLFFVSGALGLVYQVVWSRMMMQVFGSTALAVGTVLAAFMSGLAVGAWFIGKSADRSGNCLRLYAWLEIALGLAALASHLLLSRLGPAHLAIYELVGSSTALFAATRFLLTFILVMAPTVMMGATLPVLARFLTTGRNPVGVNLSTLYAVNTFGAVSGVMLTGFFLIGRYGIHFPVYLAVSGNLLIGVIAWLAASRYQGATYAPATRARAATHNVTGAFPPLGKGAYRIILFGLGLSGFTSFAYEIYWTRSLVFVLGNSTYALTTMLSAFLTGIALGGYLIRYLLRRPYDCSVVFGWLQVLLGIFSALALPLVFLISDPQSLNQYVLGTSTQAFALFMTGFGVAFMLMLIPATLIGATFPLVGQITAGDPRETGSAVGRVYAINTIGNVLGALLPGLFLLGWLGIQKGILAMAILNVSLGFIILFLRLVRPERNPGWGIALPIALVLSVLILGQAPIRFQFPSDGELDYFETLFYREGALATTKVYQNPQSGEKHISVDGIVIGGTGFSEFKQLLLAHLPKLLLDDHSSELSVGIGSGMLMGESARHPGVREITGVEIEPSVIEGASWFGKENYDVLNDPQVQIVVDDIASYLRTSTDKYQVISADEKTADAYASNGFSYSLEYYQLLRDHLAPDGLAAQWVPTTLPPSLYRMVLKTFTESFPHVQLWYFLPAHKRGPFNSILIGSLRPIPVSFDRFRQKFAQHPEAWQSLKPYGLTSAIAVIPHYVANETAIRAAVADDPVNSLEHPRYEFFYPWDFASARTVQFMANHELITSLKRQSFEDFLVSLGAGKKGTSMLRQTIAAEFRYLDAFQKFIYGIPLPEQYRLFDAALTMAPWNDSLRARIFAQYSYIASTQRDPSERTRLMRRANALYQDE